MDSHLAQLYALLLDSSSRNLQIFSFTELIDLLNLLMSLDVNLAVQNSGRFVTQILKLLEGRSFEIDFISDC